ncbi:hypothetical protein D6817_05635 [Candidatus Pacearchaeota archaeon]|nr:MAG: hypothetical protein D6817_05635 [Candidatus Pacearchaeota archaeon]
MNEFKQRNDHYRISPTAKFVAHARALSDIPYSPEIAEAVNAGEVTRRFLGDVDKMQFLVGVTAPYVEARYKAVNRGLMLKGFRNVLELAMGVSPRGLERASKSLGIYVGTDLPGLLEESSEILRGIALRHDICTDCLYFCPANALSEEQLRTASEHFKGERFGICHEGLLMYLTRDEQAKLAGNLRKLLVQSNGYWITPDVNSIEQMEKWLNVYPPEIRKTLESALAGISEKTGRNVKENNFSTNEEAEKFFTSLGFTVETFPFYDGSELSTSRLLPEDLKPRILGSLSSRAAWILKPKV